MTRVAASFRWIMRCARFVDNVGLGGNQSSGSKSTGCGEHAHFAEVVERGSVIVMV